MTIIIKFFGLLMILLGISLLFNPKIIIGWIENNKDSSALYITAVAVRLVFGILFVMAARESKYPGVIKFLGFLFIIAAIVFIFLGQESFQDFISSVIPNVSPYARVGGLLGIAFGSFLIYAFARKKTQR